MNTATISLNEFAESLVSSYAWPILWQSALVACVVALVTKTVFRRTSPQFKYCLWSLVIIRLMLPPSFYLPTGAAHWGPVLLDCVSGSRPAETTLIASLDESQPLPRVQTPAFAGMGFVPNAASAPHAASVRSASPTAPLSRDSVLLLVWSACVLLLTIVLAYHVVRFTWLLRSASAPSPVMSRLVCRCAGQLGIRRHVDLRVHERLSCPMVWGLFRPVILLPGHLARDLNEAELSTILLHELAHVKRYDCVVNWVQVLTGVVFFFNPLVWLANRQMRIEREKACDDMVLSASGLKRREYARSLLKALQETPSRPGLVPGLLGFLELRSEPVDRIARILDRTVKPVPRLRLASVVALIVFAACILPLGTRDLPEAFATDSLDQLCQLAGRVVDENGQPVAARIYVSSGRAIRRDGEYAVPIVPLSANDQGRFSIPGLATGAVTFQVFAMGHKEGSFTAASDAKDFVAVLPTVAGRGVHYQATVVDESGRPVAGARVRLVLKVVHTGDVEERISRETCTDDQGAASFDVKPAGKSVHWGGGHVLLDQEGYDLAIGSADISKDQTYQFVARKTGTPWRGRVLDERGRPAVGVLVQVVNWIGPNDVSSRGIPVLGLLDYSFRTDREGRFELARFNRKDDVRMGLTMPLHVPIQADFEGETGRTTIVGDLSKRDTRSVFRLMPGGDIRGKVVLKETGQPFAKPGRVTVTALVQLPTRPPVSRYALVQEDGSFHIAGLVPFRAALALDYLTPKERAKIRGANLNWVMRYESTDPEGKNYVWADPPSFDIRNGMTRDVVVELVKGSLVKGRVIDRAKNTAPAGSFTITATKPGSSYTAHYLGPKSDGTWAMYLPPGRHELQFHIFGQQYETQKRSIRVVEGETLDCGTLALR